MSDIDDTSAEESGTEEVLEVVAEKSETTEVEKEASSDTGEGTSVETWVVPGRFKTAEDVLNSYRHLESAYTRDRQELANLKRTMDAKANHNPDEEIGQFAEAVKRNPVEAVRTEARRVFSEYARNQQADKFISTYNTYMQNDEFRELEPVMAQLAAQVAPMIQGTALENNPILLEHLFFAARGMRQDAAAKKAEARGIQAGETAAAKKTKAIVESSSSSRGKTTKRFEDLSLDEMKRELEKGSA